MCPRFSGCILVACLLLGCSANPPAVPPISEADNLSHIDRAYHAALQKLNRPPANLEQLRPFLAEFGNPDEILKSPRDGESYVIIYGIDLRKPFPMPPPVWAHEKTGLNGKRWCMTALGPIQMTDAQFAQTTFAKP